MRGSRVRSTAYTANGTLPTNQLIRPILGNLTISKVPQDSTNIVICKPNNLGLADKLDALINQAQSEVIRIPSTGNCASSFTSKVPVGFVEALRATLNVNDNHCLDKTSTFLSTLSYYLLQAQEGYINIPRNFWDNMGEVFEELNINESKLNISSAILRSMSMAITNDAQSLPSNNVLRSTLANFDDLNAASESPIDDEFHTNYPETITPQLDPLEVLSDVVNQVPTAIGETSSLPPTNMIDVNASDSAPNIQLHNLDTDNTIEAEAYVGLKDLYSTKTLCVPISHLRIVHGGFVSSIYMTKLDYVKSVTLDNGVLTPIMGSMIVPELRKIDVSEIDQSRSIIDQDWAVAEIYRVNAVDAPVRPIYHDTIALMHNPMVLNYTAETRFRGIYTQKEYTLEQARNLGLALSALWNKVSTMKLPSNEHILAGSSILASGLGAAGSLLGSSGLVKASNIMNSLTQGLGVLLPTLSPTNGLVPEPRASIIKNASAVIPSTIEIGKSEYEKMTISSQHHRLRLNGLRKEVESSYSIPQNILAARVGLQRTGLRDMVTFN